jgi:uncharacterized protein YycO
MHSVLKRYAIRPGDRIVEPKSNLRIVQHHSIYLGSDMNGTDWIIENKVGFGVRLISADEYFRTVIEITRVERFNGTQGDRRRLVERALEQVGQPYSYINYNCEGFANYVQHGHNYSRQAGVGISLSAFSLLLIAAAVIWGE